MSLEAGAFARYQFPDKNFKSLKFNVIVRIWFLNSPSDKFPAGLVYLTVLGATALDADVLEHSRTSTSRNSPESLC